jgi:hypothetical protein
MYGWMVGAVCLKELWTTLYLRRSKPVFANLRLVNELLKVHIEISHKALVQSPRILISVISAMTGKKLCDITTRSDHTHL